MGGTWEDSSTLSAEAPAVGRNRLATWQTIDSNDSDLTMHWSVLGEPTSREVERLSMSLTDKRTQALSSHWLEKLTDVAIIFHGVLS